MNNKIWKKITGVGMAAFLFSALISQGTYGGALEKGAEAAFVQENENFPKESEVPEELIENEEYGEDVVGAEAGWDETEVLSDGTAENASSEDVSSEVDVPSEELPGEEFPEPESEPEPEPEPTLPQPELFLSLSGEPQIFKAGTTVSYQLFIENTGNTDLSRIQLTGQFSCPYVTMTWEPALGFTPDETDAFRAELSSLAVGEERTLYLTADLTEEQSQPLNLTVTACAGSAAGEDGDVWAGEGEQTEAQLVRAVSVEHEIQPLTADFAVTKTADRSAAFPGDTVTYEICIRNTGERTLHSVISTERFLNADISARFEEQEGVTLNRKGTRAMISSILPGESVTLTAKVTIPDTVTDRELINEVTVTTAETGTRTEQSASAVTVEAPPATEPPQELSGESGQEAEPPAVSAVSVKENPQTADPTAFEVFLAAAGVSICLAWMVGRKLLKQL